MMFQTSPYQQYMFKLFIVTKHFSNQATMLTSCFPLLLIFTMAVSEKMFHKKGQYDGRLVIKLCYSLIFATPFVKTESN